MVCLFEQKTAYDLESAVVWVTVFQTWACPTSWPKVGASPLCPPFTKKSMVLKKAVCFFFGGGGGEMLFLGFFFEKRKFMAKILLRKNEIGGG